MDEDGLIQSTIIYRQSSFLKLLFTAGIFLGDCI